MAVSRKNKKKLKNICWYAAGIVIGLMFLFPIYCMVIKSVMPDEQLTKAPSLVPDWINLEPYVTAISPEYLQYLKNTLIVCVMNVLGVWVAAPLTAFALAKVHFKGKKYIFGLILATVMLPGTVTSIPMYSIYLKMGWTGTLLPLIVPIWFGGGAMNIFLIRQFIRGIPNTYMEAATLDGASQMRIYARIILPMIRPIMIYLGVMTFIGCWNDFQGPLMYVSNNREKWTLSLALYQNFADAANATNLPNVQMAVGVIMMIPCVLFYAFFQKELVEGVAGAGIKG